MSVSSDNTVGHEIRNNLVQSRIVSRRDVDHTGPARRIDRKCPSMIVGTS
jgi:hypothetical protein